MATRNSPSLFQINTRVWITELTSKLARPATLDDIPDSALDHLAAEGFDWIWFLSVWQTGKASRKVSRTNDGWRKEFHETLPDLKEEDIGGSGFAITGYTVHQSLGGDEALARLRQRLQKRGLKLMLDFVPNHMALDHPWLAAHPDYFISGTPDDLQRSPNNYIRIKQGNKESIFAYGRDPYFDGWPDTLQLNYGNPAAREAMRGELVRISGQCDGVRCDMAMLVLPEIFERTWGIKSQAFWPEAIGKVKEAHPEFVFMAEVYWDMEWTLQQQGFNYTYDKHLYDKLKEGNAGPVRGHLRAELDFQYKSARFLENHDEPRAAATFTASMHQAAAIVTFFTPGLRFFHQGQFEGKKKRISPHLVRGPEEPTDENLKKFYGHLLEALKQTAFRKGSWKLLECAAIREDNRSHENYIAFAFEASKSKMVIVVNYSAHQSQCFLKLPFEYPKSGEWRFEDLFSKVIYDRSCQDLQQYGLFLDEPGWKFYVFTVGLFGNQ